MKVYLNNGKRVRCSECVKVAVLIVECNKSSLHLCPDHFDVFVDKIYASALEGIKKIDPNTRWKFQDP